MTQVALSQESRNVFVALTDDEVAKYAQEAAKITLDIGELEDQKKAAASTFKDRIDRAFCTVRELSRKVTDHRELRDVECIWYADTKKKKAFLVRQDTGEEVASRDLTVKEMQAELPGTEKK